MLKGTFVKACDLPCKNTVVVVYSTKKQISQEQISLLRESISGSYAIKYAFIDDHDNIELLMQEDYDRIFPKNAQN